MKDEILKLLVCPKTKEQLILEDNKLVQAEQNYPIIQEVPWLFKDPEKNFFLWAGKIQQFIREEKSYLKYLQNMETLTSSKATKKRLTQIKEAKTKNLKVMQTTLADFEMEQELPGEMSTQQIHSYFELIFRDWAWEGNEEVETYFKYLKANIKAETKNILILGCGASGLNYKLAKEFPDKNFIGLDHNPFLLLTAQKLFNGHEVKLWDYQNYSPDENNSKSYKIKPEKLEVDNHLLVLGSFPDLPLKDQSIDTIIAPWFFDIIDFDFEEATKYSTKYLKEDGQFILFGPTNLHKKEILAQKGKAELDEYLASLFESYTSEQKDVKYLENELTSQNRLEKIYFFTGHKPKSFESYPIKAPELNLHYTPDFERYKAVNETYYHILKHITADITADDLAVKIHQEFGFSPEESLYYADNFIQKLNFELK